jgi:ribonuclease R
LDIQKTRMMVPHVGETFTGVITGVTNFGFFVQLNEFFVEGLVHVTTLGRDYYVFDESRMSLTGRQSGQSFTIGTKVKVQLAAANVTKHKLDFELVREVQEQRRPPPRSSAPWKKHPRHRS